ncbi:MAG TPA: hypothetical protein PKD90_14400, partial [Phnomibacter sp.]|nr:hypothetical protein [Phnomibacter sp.]
MNRSFEFEVLAADRFGKANIQTVQALMHGLLFDEKLWHTPELVEKNGNYLIKDAKAGMVLTAQFNPPLGTSASSNAPWFGVRVGTRQADLLDGFRTKLLTHLQQRLHFSDLRIVKDDVTCLLAEKCFSYLQPAQARIRSTIIRFFTQKLGYEWMQLFFGHSVGNPESAITSYSCQAAFEELVNLLLQPVGILQNNSYLYEKILQAAHVSELQQLQVMLKNNYATLIQTHFMDAGFNECVQVLLNLQRKLANSAFLTQADLTNAESTYHKVISILEGAEEALAGFSFDEASLKLLDDSTNHAAHSGVWASARRLRAGNFDVKVVGKIDLPEGKRRWQRPEEGPMPEYQEEVEERAITEPELLENLEKAELWHHERGMDYVGLKGFVTKWLANNHFAIPPAYSLVNELKE